MSEPLMQPASPAGAMPDSYKRDLALLRGVLGAIDSTLECYPALGLALQIIVEQHPGLAGMVLIGGKRELGFEIVAHRGLPAEHLPQRIFVDHRPCREAIDTAQPLLFVECSAQECPAAVLEGKPHGCLVSPLKTHQAVLGLLCLFYPPGFGQGSLDLSLWEDIGLQLGRRLAMHRIEVQAEQERELLHTLYAVSNHLATSLDPDWVLSNALELSISATDARDGSIFLLPAPGTTAPRILRRALSGAEADQVIGEVLAGGLAGWVVRHKEGAIIADTTRDPRWLSLPNDPSPAGSALAVPLKARGRVLGVLTLDHAQPDHFDNRQMALMRAIAHQISTAIERARLYDEVTHLAEVLARRVEERTRELKETQAQLIQAEKLAALGELAAGIAHEINNPLHILQAYVEYIVARARPGDVVLDLVEPMDNALDNVARLAQQLRDFSRPASGQWQPFDVNEAIGRVLRLVNKELINWRITVQESLAGYLPQVRGDIRQMEQVFLNLILNARDAMPGGGDLTIETRADTDTVYATVRDTGIGIRQEDLARIFEPYFTTKQDRGTGLGLAICQRVVVQHGGKLTVHSKLGQGAAFTVHLPADTYDAHDTEAAGVAAADGEQLVAT